MINGELVIEWKKEKSIKVVVVENICYDPIFDSWKDRKRLQTQ